MKLFRFLLAFLMCLPTISHAAVDDGQPQDLSDKASFAANSHNPVQKNSSCSWFVEQERRNREILGTRLISPNMLSSEDKGIIECLKQASSAGDVESQYLLGMKLMSAGDTYRFADFADKFFAEGLDYLEQASDGGHQVAQKMVTDSRNFLRVSLAAYVLCIPYALVLVWWNHPRVH